MRGTSFDARAIKGKKYYCYEYLLFGLMHGPCILFFFVPILLDLEGKGRGALAIMCYVLGASFFVAAGAFVLATRKCVCAVTDDRLYFFGCDCTVNGQTRKNANGYVLLSAIREMVHVAPPRSLWWVVVRGSDFEVILPQMRVRPIRAAKKRNSSLHTRLKWEKIAGLCYAAVCDKDIPLTSSGIFFEEPSIK